MKTRAVVTLFIWLFMMAGCMVMPQAVALPAPEPAPVQPAPVASVESTEAGPESWLTYANPAGFSIQYPATWTQEELPQQTGETIHTATLKGAEGDVQLQWGIGFGGACPQGYTTVKVAEGELPTCYFQRDDGTEVWSQISKQLATTSFSADAETSNAAPASHDLVLQILATLSFPPPQQSTAPLTARMLTAPGALVGPSPSSFNWSPVGALLLYVAQQDGQDVLWLYDAATGDKNVLLDPATSPGNIDVTSAQWSPLGDNLLLAGDTALWLLDVNTGDLKSLAVGGSGVTGLMFTPDGTRVSYVQANDLYVIGIADGKIQRLTTDGGETVFNGGLDWVYNEELATRAAQPAYAWSPDGVWLIYLRLDETAVHQDPVTDYRPVPATVSYTRYPTVGTPNPTATLHAMAEGATAPPLAVPLPADAEYVLPFFTWTPDSNHALFITVNRDHTELTLNMWTPQSGELRALIKETAPDWVNEDRYAAPVLIGDDVNGAGQFLWLSERDGFMRPYLYTLEGKLVRQLTQGDWMIDSSGFNVLTPGRPVHVDPAGTWAYFITTRASPLERQIERVNIASGQLEQVSQQPGFHLFALSSDGSYLVDQFSAVDLPPITQIVGTGGGAAASETTVLAEAAGPALTLPQLTREFVTLKAHDGTDLYAQLVKPENFDPARQYPVVVHWYGGPVLQMVSNRYGTTNIFNHIERDVLYTQAGFLVWRLDNRGAFGRGHAFETPIFGELGKAALDDQLAGIEYLKTLPYVDASRIGTDGKSFGGYMTLYALIHAADVFRCGVAGAAPTDWSYYDTIYTERYMRTPEVNPDGYAATNLIAKASQIQARPLLIHGLADTNVHLQNTVNFIQALQANDKLFDFIPLPNLSHSFRGDGLVAALSASVNYLGQCLGAEPTPAQPASAGTEQPAATTATPPTAPDDTAAAPPAAVTLQPLSSEMCIAFAQAIANALNTRVAVEEAPISDPVTGASGAGCQAAVTGTGEQFTSPQATVAMLAGLLLDQGWTADPKLAADGPTGTASGFRQENQLCWADAGWQPDASADCPQDQPIAACQVAPKQQIYTVTLNCGVATAQTAPATEAQDQTADPLPSWNPGPAKDAILKFVADVTDPAGQSYVVPADRIAVFDNDGTLWTEKPVVPQAAFIFQRIVDLAPQHPEWQTTQPYAAVLQGDAQALANLSAQDVQALIYATSAGMTEEEFEAAAKAFLDTAKHPRFQVPYTQAVYQPMLELLAFLRANGFKSFVVSGGGADFMRVYAEEILDTPRDDVVGSSPEYKFEPSGDSYVLLREPGMEPMNLNEMKPINIQRHIGRRPILAGGNSDGDLEMFQYTGGGGGPYLNLVIVHDDAEREYDYLAGADKLMAAAAQSPWTFVSMKKDFKTIFPTEAQPAPESQDQMVNPASANCTQQGGTLTITARGDGGEYGICTFEDNRQCEEWALFNGDCPAGGLKVTGYITPAAQYCAITGGTYAITGNSGQEDEQGACTFKDGSQCDVWDYYNGKCAVQ